MVSWQESNKTQVTGTDETWWFGWVSTV